MLVVELLDVDGLTSMSGNDLILGMGLLLMDITTTLYRNGNHIIM